MEIFRELLNYLGLNADDYGTHSLRRGGATVSAMNNISDRLFKNIGDGKATTLRTVTSLKKINKN
jgi:hypothetical protein